MGVSYKNLSAKSDFSQMHLSRPRLDYECGAFCSDWSDRSDFWLWMQPMLFVNTRPV